MLRLKHISLSYNQSILNDVSIQVKQGECLGIVGPSGAGKSSLLRIMAGLLDPDQGAVSLDGERVKGPKDKLIPGHPDIALLNQDYQLDRYHTVYENLILQTGHLNKNLQTDWCAELLELTELSNLKDRQAFQLSGGEQQRLALARALATEPKFLLLDEPFGHQDAHLRRKFLHYLDALKRVRKTSFVLVSHDGQEVLGLADRIAFLDQGKIQRLDLPEAFYLAPSNEHEGQFFGHLNEITLNRRKLMFRPGEWQIEAREGYVPIEIRFKSERNHGLYSLMHCRYKKQDIYLLKKEGIELPDLIYIAEKR